MENSLTPLSGTMLSHQLLHDFLHHHNSQHLPATMSCSLPDLQQPPSPMAQATDPESQYTEKSSTAAKNKSGSGKGASSHRRRAQCWCDIQLYQQSKSLQPRPHLNCIAVLGTLGTLGTPTVLFLSIPPIPVAPLMCMPTRKDRKAWANPGDPHMMVPYGNPLIQKLPTSTQFSFQNVEGLSSSSGSEDYRYYLKCLQSLQVDVAGLVEISTCWQHPHLRDDMTSLTR
jgi:hypothetical protein